MNFGIAMFPSKQLQDKVNQYRKRYDAHYALIPPHITLKEKFEADESEKEKISQHLKEIAKKHKPTDIEIKKVSSFSPNSLVIYFKVEKNDELVALHDDLNDGEFYGENSHPFVPHLTIAQGQTTQEYEDIFGQLSMVGIDHQETLDKMSLLYQLDNGVWQVYETYKLGEG
ncbi:YjcG family protein [Salinicoccus siamensis]|uniref:Putative phosphoesterase ACFFLE_04025 n=1 Tax=Salinicoccus siamensis TaxID=381830 RepID=A0ABV5Z2K3_9STAP